MLRIMLAGSLIAAAVAPALAQGGVSSGGSFRGSFSGGYGQFDRGALSRNSFRYSFSSPGFPSRRLAPVDYGYLGYHGPSVFPNRLYLSGDYRAIFNGGYRQIYAGPYASGQGASHLPYADFVGISGGGIPAPEPMGYRITVEPAEGDQFLVIWHDPHGEARSVEFQALDADGKVLHSRAMKEPPFRGLLRLPEGTASVRVTMVDRGGREVSRRVPVAEFRGPADR